MCGTTFSKCNGCVNRFLHFVSKKLFCIICNEFDRIEVDRQPLFSLFVTFLFLGCLITFSQGKTSRNWAITSPRKTSDSESVILILWVPRCFQWNTGGLCTNEGKKLSSNPFGIGRTNGCGSSATWHSIENREGPVQIVQII